MSSDTPLAHAQTHAHMDRQRVLSISLRSLCEGCPLNHTFHTPPEIAVRLVLDLKRNFLSFDCKLWERATACVMKFNY